MNKNYTQETDTGYVTGQQSSRSVAPQDVGIAQEKLGDVSGSVSRPDIQLKTSAPLQELREMKLIEKAERDRILEIIDELAYWSPHCDNCTNQKFIVKVEELKQKIKEVKE